MFTEEQRQWIVLEFGKDFSPASVKRKFIIKRGINGSEKAWYRFHYFSRVFEDLKENKIAKDPRSKAVGATKIQANAMQQVRTIAKKLKFGK